MLHRSSALFPTFKFHLKSLFSPSEPNEGSLLCDFIGVLNWAQSNMQCFRYLNGSNGLHVYRIESNKHGTLYSIFQPQNCLHKSNRRDTGNRETRTMNANATGNTNRKRSNQCVMFYCC